MTPRSVTVRWIESERERILAGWFDGIWALLTWSRRP